MIKEERCFARLAEREPETAAHCRRVAAMCEIVCDELGIRAHTKRDILIAALLHDVGKLHVPGSVLHAPRALTAEEWRYIYLHCEEGEKIARQYGMSPKICAAVRGHHERMNGSGYPDHLAGDQLTLGMRIIGACDALDAMLWKRCYKESRSEYDCKVALMRDAEMFDPAVLSAILGAWENLIFAGKKIGESGA